MECEGTSHLRAMASMRQGWWCSKSSISSHGRGSPMSQITRAVVPDEAVRVGVDLAKRVIQVHAVDAAGRVLTTRALARDKFIARCAQLPAGCIVAMETSSSSHHWARKLIAPGLDAHLGPHCKRITRSAQQGRLQRSSLLLRSSSSAPPARSSTAVHHRDVRTRSQIPLAKKRKSLQGVSHHS